MKSRLRPLEPLSKEQRIERSIEMAFETGKDEGFAACLVLLQEPTDAVLDAMRAAAAAWLDLPPGVEGEREKYRRRLRAAVAAIGSERSR
jgi:hypothetical protein